MWCHVNLCECSRTQPARGRADDDLTVCWLTRSLFTWVLYKTLACFSPLCLFSLIADFHRPQVLQTEQLHLHSSDASIKLHLPQQLTHVLVLTTSDSGVVVWHWPWRIPMSPQMWTFETPMRSPSWPTWLSSCSTPETCQCQRRKCRSVSLFVSGAAAAAAAASAEKY